MTVSVTLPDLVREPAEPAEPAGAAEDAAPEAAAVVVRLGGSRYAVPMEAVAEVGRVPDITRVPGVPRWVAGVANWRGRMLPILDLRPLLDPETAGHAVGGSGRVVVTGDDAVSVGLLVEAVDGVATPPDDVDPAPATVGGEAAALLAGQWTDESGPLGLIDVPSLLRLREQLPRRG